VQVKEGGLKTQISGCADDVNVLDER